MLKRSKLSNSKNLRTHGLGTTNETTKIRNEEIVSELEKTVRNVSDQGKPRNERLILVKSMDATYQRTADQIRNTQKRHMNGKRTNALLGNGSFNMSYREQLINTVINRSRTPPREKNTRSQRMILKIKPPPQITDVTQQNSNHKNSIFKNEGLAEKNLLEKLNELRNLNHIHQKEIDALQDECDNLQETIKTCSQDLQRKYKLIQILRQKMDEELNLEREERNKEQINEEQLKVQYEEKVKNYQELLFKKDVAYREQLEIKNKELKNTVSENSKLKNDINILSRENERIKANRLLEMEYFMSRDRPTEASKFCSIL